MTVFTIIFNDYDKLKEPIYANPDVDYVVFSDTPQTSDVWRWVKTDFPNGVKDQRKLKILGHEKFKGDTLYIDASIMIFHDPIEIIKFYPGDLVLLEHRGRNCIYVEFAICTERGLDDYNVMLKQINRYIREGYPQDNGMVQTGFMLRRGNKLNKFYRAWWKEVKNGSIRDQLSFNYVAWKHNIDYSLIPQMEFIRSFKLNRHAH